MKPTEQRRTGGHVRPAGWRVIWATDQVTNWATVNWSTQLWTLVT